MDSIKVSCTYDTVDAPDTVWRTVSVTTDAPEACEVYGSGVYADSSTVEIGFLLADTAIEGGRWQFLGWSDGVSGNPRDILVTGVDDVNLATLVSPTITTVRQPCAEIAATVLETLFWRFDNPEKEKRRIMVAADLVVRESTTR